MKLLNILIFVSIILFSSCDDFLEYKQGDILVPKTAESYKEFVYGEIIYENEINTLRNLEFMTDNIDEKFVAVTRYTSDYRENLWGYFTWQAIPENSYTNKIKEDKIWSTYYHKIFMCNIVLNDLEKIQGSDNDKNVLKAEVLFLRAYSYLILANTYAKPYIDEIEAKKEHSGVPINNEISVEDKLYVRASLFDNYKIIEEDLKESIRLFGESEYIYSIFRPNIDVARLIYCRALLYQKKYQACIDVANELIDFSDKTIYDLNNVGDKEYFFTVKNTNIIFSNGVDSYLEYEKGSKACFVASDDLFDLYTANDRRRIIGWYRYNPLKPYKFKSSDLYDMNLRIEEAYLNRAEAYAELKKKDEAKADVMSIRKKRMPENFDLSVETLEDAIRIVREERRREFCFEHQRWFDLRRWQHKNIIHTYTMGEEVKTYVLKKNSDSYTMPIPQKVLLSNDRIQNINRPERNND